MDFSFKSKLWAGNIYHRFESICQEVDGFVNKDAVKFVGNQVQSVGVSVKRLYSDVVQDIPPLSVDPAKPERQLAAGKQVDTQDPVSVSGIKTPSTSADDMQLAKNQVSNDHKIQISKPADVKEAQNCQHLREQDNAMVENSKDNINTEKSVTEDSKPAAASSSFESETLSSKCDNDICSSPSSSVHEEGSTTIEKEIRNFNHKKGDEGFTDYTVLRMVEDLLSVENGSLSSPEVPVSTHKVIEDYAPVMDSPLPIACDVDDWASEKYRALSESCSTKDESVDLSTSVKSSEHVFAHHSCNEKEKITAIMPSTSCTSPKSSISVESTSKDFSTEAENILHFRSLSDSCTYNISAVSSINDADKTKEVNVDSAFLIMESNDDNALQSGRSEFLFSSFECGHEEHHKNGHSGTVISPSETATTCALDVPICDLDLETVELTPNMKRDGRSVVFNSNLVVPGSYRRRNFRYYKKLIHGAFTSQKRISKEYEHLAIMYGDTDVESNQHFDPSSSSSFLNTALHADEKQSSHEMSENEWELL